MKAKIFLRVARGVRGIKVEASNKPNYRPIMEKDFRGDKYFPTAAFAISLDIPDELFKQAEREIANIVVGLKKANIAAEVVVPGKKDVEKK